MNTGFRVLSPFELTPLKPLKKACEQNVYFLSNRYGIHFYVLLSAVIKHRAILPSDEVLTLCKETLLEKFDTTLFTYALEHVYGLPKRVDLIRVSTEVILEEYKRAHTISA